MAGRCGCGGGTCNCVLEVEEPLTKEGGGSVVSPWKLGLDKDALFNDIAGNGLSWNETTNRLQACLSRDTGNSLRFGADGCLYAPGGDTPMPDVCARPIASLPAAPDVVGAYSTAQLRGPYNSPYQVDYCLATDCDIIHFRCATSSDDVGVITDLDNHRVEESKTSVYISQEIRQMSAAALSKVWNYAGDTDDPVAYFLPAGGDRTDRRGGWYGFLAQPYFQPLLWDFLTKISGKSVALIECVPNADVPYGEDQAVIGPIRGVLEHCAQPWAMIGVSQIATAATVTGAGITACMIPAIPSTWADTTLPYPVADLQAAGVEWILLSDLYADSVFATYRDAGLQVLMNGNSRHVERARVETLAIRGTVCDDPVYYRGPLVGDWSYGYRTESDPWEHRQIATGQLTHRTDAKAVVATSGSVRGRTDAAEQGLILPENFGRGLGRPSVLCGWECPMTNPNAYSITWDMRWNTLATVLPDTAKMGLLFAAETDAEPYSWPQDSIVNPIGFPEGQRTLYRVYQRQTGEIGIAKWAGATGSYTTLATTDTPAVAEGFWNSYELVVTDTQITFTRELIDGTRYTVTAADTEYRGGYFWIEKEESGQGSAPNPFEGMFRNVLYTAAG